MVEKRRGMTTKSLEMATRPRTVKLLSRMARRRRMERNQLPLMRSQRVMLKVERRRERTSRRRCGCYFENLSCVNRMVVIIPVYCT